MGASELGMLVARVLSGDKGTHEIASTDRDKVCLLSNGMLYIAQSYKQDMAVLAYIQLLKHRRFQYTIEYVSVTDIQRLYAEHAGVPGGGRQDESFRQKEVQQIVMEAVAKGASDIHFINGENTTTVFMRIDGFVEQVHVLKAEDGNALCATIYTSMTDVADTNYKQGQCQDGRVKKEFLQSCGLFGARISTRPTDDGNYFVLRLLPNNGKKVSLAQLGYEEQVQIPLIRRMTTRTTGINIFTGATGSGKSTTLHALMSEMHVNTRGRTRILTIEDPPEYPIEGAVQTPLICDRDSPEAVAAEWVRSISSSMRLDPDVMMVGEMRDRESASTAFRAAMTGHGVWTTLHANNALQALDRLIDMGVTESFVTDAALVTGLINQSLCATNCPDCKRAYKRYKRQVAPELQERIEQYCNPEMLFLRGNDKACKTCGGKGYKGRTVIAEVCVPNQKIMNAYRRGGAAEARDVWVKEFGGLTKASHLIRKINAGLIDPEIAEEMVCPIDEDFLTLG